MTTDNTGPRKPWTPKMRVQYQRAKQRLDEIRRMGPLQISTKEHDPLIGEVPFVYGEGFVGPAGIGEGEDIETDEGEQ